MLPLISMQATQPPRTVFIPKTRKRQKPVHRLNTYIVDEIHAYATIRDIALAEAEKEPNALNVQRARIANEFVAKSLRPARSPYEAQHLPEADAKRERENCETVNVRIALLQAHLDAMNPVDDNGAEPTQADTSTPLNGA